MPADVSATHPDVKYSVPVALHVVDRPRLYDLLDLGAESPVTLVSASAGWGKTVLLASWLGARAVERPAWLTVGPADDTPDTFWRAVATSLAAVVGAPADALLRRVADDRSGTDLADRVADAVRHVVGPAVLVLDEVHQITSPEVWTGLHRWITAPPEGVRLVVLTRRDPPWPLHRLRLAGLLAEVRASDLAFVPPEARELFALVGVELTTDQLELLVRRTDGWAAGLRLAALPLRAPGADVASFLASFSGDDRTVTAYLQSEVLEPQSERVLRFLEKICILDLVCAELADAVTGDDDGAAMLAELSASNLFVQAVGEGGRWFRLPGFVTDVLRSRMVEPRARRDLYRRAAEWYRRRSLPEAAIRLALAGGLLPLAAELVGVHDVGLVLRGRGRELDTMLAAVPRDALLAHPELAAGLAGARMVYGRDEELADLIGAAEARLEALPAPRARRVRLVLDLIALADARLRGDLDGLAAACRRIPLDPGELAELGLAGWDLVRVLTLSNQGTAELWLGELDAAEVHLRAATEAEPAVGLVLPRVNALAQLALLECARGHLTLARTEARAVVARATATGSAPTIQVVSAYLALAWAHLDSGELSEVDPWLRKAEEVAAAAPEPHVALTMAVLRAHRRAENDPEAALLGLQTRTRALAPSVVPARLLDRSLLAQAELAVQLHDPVRGRSALAGLQAHDTPEAVVALAGMHLLEGDPDGAEQLLAGLGGGPSTVRTQVATDLLWALAAAARGDDEAALGSLDRALHTAAPHELRRPLTARADGLRRLLSRRIERGTGAAAFAVELMSRLSRQLDPAPDPARRTPTPLTPRETVILRYLSSTLGNSEIAAELSVSINTVKTHQQTVYRKLGVGGRREAVRRARELRLL
ncbi:LuxR C-terminal-related transcriptional regulator [Actinomycetospora chibensis]|uniref:LuxR C-terminal-related transcriptional regulator n=1 Tax=Actinomycetospora chibensis TaxID=663606 RepID=A0ABV9RTA2_9PSEU|nr:LuxR C-terminal-related transcriptional regulator [Actinomycetospora chibensis]MDD7922355.1 LuxR C-terminal-related transcriptional regulator [Actinomycetospora chibensis]